MSKKILRGEIWIVDWSPSRGSEQTGLRPAVVIQTDAANTNPYYPNTVVVTVSTKGKPVPFHVPVNPSGENGLKEASFVKCEQVLTISKDRLVRRLGSLEEKHMQAVAVSLRKVLELCIVCAYAEEANCVIIITAYQPSPNRWIDFERRPK